MYVVCRWMQPEQLGWFWGGVEALMGLVGAFFHVQGPVGGAIGDCRLDLKASI